MDSPLSALNSQLRRRSGRRSGFALLITITLLAFIVVLLIGLATYSRIETAIAGNTQRQAQARQNAIFALNVAVAQLQKYAGPDEKVTATADAFNAGADAQKKRYTGVWSTRLNDDGTAPTPVWLASGLETGTSPDPLTATANGNKVALVGRNTDGSAAFTATGNPGADNVVADLQSITAPGVPGRTGNTVIGKYAWWVGDNGVKADIARGDASAKLNYPPFVTAAVPATETEAEVPGVAIAEMKKRLYQQTGLGAGAFDTASSAASFDPRDTTNTTLVANTLALQQLPYLKTPTNAALGLAALKSHYHAWTIGNFNVLARTNAAVGEASLRNDLSTNPDALGSGFKAWADYPSYMESPALYPGAAGNTPPENALRRRYKMVPAVVDADHGTRFGVTPVLTFFALSVSIHNTNLAAGGLDNHLDASVRCVASFWNPYTGALVPEDLEMRVTGLPTVRMGDFVAGNPIPSVPLQQLYGDATLLNADDPAAPTVAPLRFLLPKGATGADDQNASWLPGRTYSWSAADNTKASETGTNAMIFGQRDLQTTTTGDGMVRRAQEDPLPVLAPNNSTPLYRHAIVDATTELTIELRRASDGVLLATFKSPGYRRFSTDESVQVSPTSRNLDFAYVFRIKDPVVDGFPWLTTPGVDVRAPEASAESLYTLPDRAENPAAFVADATTSPLTTFANLRLGNASLLLDRDPGLPLSPTGVDFNEDVPVFELPRSPLLSVAQLQHLSIPEKVPFLVGRSTTGGAWGNALFDQHFFSGLGAGTTWTDTSAPLPNTLARVLRRKPDGTALALADLYPTSISTPDPAAPDNPDAPPIVTTSMAGLSAKYVMQGGAFNLNSTNPDAWAAVLRSVRFPEGREFQYLDADPTTGTASDSTVATLTAEAAFPRYSQSAQETYKTSPGYLHTDSNTTNSFTVHTEYYRKGFRTLDAATVTLLAQKIASLVETHIRAHGPYKSVQEFLDPISTTVPDPNDDTLTITTTGPSVLEQAIIDLKLNQDPNIPVDPDTQIGGDYPMSSIYLTQADIMTVLAPVLFTRSDTFTVRAYGEANNPLTGATEGKAWCEAIVQRLPEPVTAVDATKPTDDEYRIPGAGGRRFKIISLRWLTRSDI